MGKTVFAYQFVAGLIPEIKRKVAGSEGSFDQLLAKTRYEEAKTRDLGGEVNKRPPVNAFQKGNSQQTPGDSRIRPGLQCYNCQGTGHFARNCPLRRRADPVESAGRRDRVGAVILEEGPESLEEKVARLRQELHEAEAEQAAGDTVTTMRVLQAQGKPDKVPLGPILTAWINFEGTDTKAVIDTGSPVTIVSLEFAMEALAKQKKSDQTPDDWKKEVQQEFKPCLPSFRVTEEVNCM